ncbi:sensor histidine kinase [Nonomuraea sp. SMC257]|uniref:histidine kinase n=1 Tax=Nonomuraea montanisoli TaxID=2741721 RepID=A0A7Y6IF84_9ACTN|nr:sensor histidine kinase [Nonomuraea montanisoli]NUW36535.1 sensor histidine kinase [Nonomuraea montanisoli]
MDALRGAPLALLALVTVRANVTGTGASLHLAQYVVLSALLIVPLLWQRRRPLETFAAVSLVSFGQWALGFDPVPANLSVLLALWSVAYGCAFRWALAAGLIAELGVYLVLVHWHTVSFSMFFSGSIFVVTTWLTGLYANTRRRFLEGLEERAERAERERDQQARLAATAERARIARELHDVVAHNVSVMVVQADGAGYMIDRDPEQVRQAVRNISRTGRDALAEMRRLVGVLRADPEDGGADGDGAGGTDYTPQPRLAQLEELVRGAGVPARLRVTGPPCDLPEGQQLAVYRIIQEALTNALKHGGPGVRALVELTYGRAELVVRVTDDGRGAAAPRSHDGHGLVGMRERVGMYGGAVSAEPRPGGGFEVLARLPVPAGRAA